MKRRNRELFVNKKDKEGEWKNERHIKNLRI